jgi:hypothetical protein
MIQESVNDLKEHDLFKKENIILGREHYFRKRKLC